MHLAQFGFAQAPPDAGQVDGLAAGHALAAGRPCQQAHQPRLHGSRDVRLVGHQQFEGQRLQRVAGQQRIGLAELHVHGGLATAQHVVVHAGQVVVHERIGMDQFDRTGRAQRRLADGGARRGERRHRFARGQHQQRSKALAPIEHRITHGLAEQHRGIDAHPARQRRLDARELRFGPVGQLVLAPALRHAAHCADHVLRLPASSTLIWSSTAWSLSRQKASSAAPRW